MYIMNLWVGCVICSVFQSYLTLELFSLKLPWGKFFCETYFVLSNILNSCGSGIGSCELTQGYRHYCSKETMHSKFYDCIFATQKVVKWLTKCKTLPAKNWLVVQSTETDEQVEIIWDHRSKELVSGLQFTTTGRITKQYRTFCSQFLHL